jgi:glycosyltransferase involved in cell wall biosynthesis
MVHPSLFEGVPRAAIESFACGTPVVGLRRTLAGPFSDLPFVTLVEEEGGIGEAVSQLLSDTVNLEIQSGLARDYAKQYHGEGRLAETAVSFDYCIRNS